MPNTKKKTLSFFIFWFFVPSKTQKNKKTKNLILFQNKKMQSVTTTSFTSFQHVSVESLRGPPSPHNSSNSSGGGGGNSPTSISVLADLHQHALCTLHTHNIQPTQAGHDVTMHSISAGFLDVGAQHASVFARDSATSMTLGVRSSTANGDSGLALHLDQQHNTARIGHLSPLVSEQGNHLLTASPTDVHIAAPRFVVGCGQETSSSITHHASMRHRSIIDVARIQSVTDKLECFGNTPYPITFQPGSVHASSGLRIGANGDEDMLHLWAADDVRASHRPTWRVAQIVEGVDLALLGDASTLLASRFGIVGNGPVPGTYAPLPLLSLHHDPENATAIFAPIPDHHHALGGLSLSTDATDPAGSALLTVDTGLLSVRGRHLSLGGGSGSGDGAPCYVEAGGLQIAGGGLGIDTTPNAEHLFAELLVGRPAASTVSALHIRSIERSATPHHNAHIAGVRSTILTVEHDDDDHGDNVDDVGVDNHASTTRIHGGGNIMILQDTLALQQHRSSGTAHWQLPTKTEVAATDWHRLLIGGGGSGSSGGPIAIDYHNGGLWGQDILDAMSAASSHTAILLDQYPPPPSFSSAALVHINPILCTHTILPPPLNQRAPPPIFDSAVVPPRGVGLTSPVRIGAIATGEIDARNQWVRHTSAQSSAAAAAVIEPAPYTAFPGGALPDTLLLRVHNNNGTGNAMMGGDDDDDGNVLWQQSSGVTTTTTTTTPMVGALRVDAQGIAAIDETQVWRAPNISWMDATHRASGATVMGMHTALHPPSEGSFMHTLTYTHPTQTDVQHTLASGGMLRVATTTNNFVFAVDGDAVTAHVPVRVPEHFVETPEIIAPPSASSLVLQHAVRVSQLSSSPLDTVAAAATAAAAQITSTSAALRIAVTAQQQQAEHQSEQDSTTVVTLTEAETHLASAHTVVGGNLTVQGDFRVEGARVDMRVQEAIVQDRDLRLAVVRRSDDDTVEETEEAVDGAGLFVVGSEGDEKSIRYRKSSAHMSPTVTDTRGHWEVSHAIHARAGVRTDTLSHGQGAAAESETIRVETIIAELAALRVRYQTSLLSRFTFDHGTTSGGGGGGAVRIPAKTLCPFLLDISSASSLSSVESVLLQPACPGGGGEGEGGGGGGRAAPLATATMVASTSSMDDLVPPPPRAYAVRVPSTAATAADGSFSLWPAPLSSVPRLVDAFVAVHGKGTSVPTWLVSSVLSSPPSTIAVLTIMQVRESDGVTVSHQQLALDHISTATQRDAWGATTWQCRYAWSGGTTGGVLAFPDATTTTGAGTTGGGDVVAAALPRFVVSEGPIHVYCGIRIDRVDTTGGGGEGGESGALLPVDLISRVTFL